MLVTPIQVLALDIDGVLTDGRAEVGTDGDEQKRFSFRDLDAITQARQSGLQVVLVTGEDNQMVDAIARRLGVDDVVRGAKDKRAAIEAIAARLGVAATTVCYMGDSDRDAPALAWAGLGLVPADASPAAKAAAHRVLTCTGGDGVVAEAVTLLARHKEDVEKVPQLEARMRCVVEDSLLAHQRLLDESLPILGQIAATLIRALRAGRKILLFGNGGSAADAQHVAGELVGRFLQDRQPCPVIALTTDTSVLTATGNDWGFAEIFARQVRALAKPGDVAVGISTSGRSANVLRALAVGRELGAITVGFTGVGGGQMLDVCDICFCAPTDAAPRIQELHILGWHAICEVIETHLLSTWPKT